MNNIEFNLPGGFPLETDTLNAMKSAYSSLHAFGSAVGNYAIIKGCEVNGASTANGYVFLNGELIEFRGGLTQSKVVVNEVRIRKQFKDGTEPEVYFERWVSFGTGTQAIDWNIFKRPKTAIQLSEDQALKAENADLVAVAARLSLVENLLLPFQAGGAMVFWNKPANQIPQGWREVTAWRGRMPVGFHPSISEFNALGKTGGQRAKTLSVAEMPKHSHRWKFGEGQATDNGLRRDGVYYSDLGQSSSNGRRAVDRNPFEETGSGNAFSLLNPYRTVLFIEPTRIL